MASYNKAILMGNLTHDSELRYTPQGTAITDLRLAVNTKSKNKDEVLYIDVTVWDRMAENCCEYLSKGKPVLVEGRLVIDQWEDSKSGEKRSKHKVVATNVQFVGSRSDGADEERSTRKEQPAQKRNTQANEFDDFGGDDIQF